jgi:hypothetical protein
MTARARKRTRNRSGVEGTLRALRGGGRLEGVDDATVALARHLAWALDEVDPVEFPAQSASLARAQLATLRLLRGKVDDDDGGGSGLDELLAALGDPPVA